MHAMVRVPTEKPRELMLSAVQGITIVSTSIGFISVRVQHSYADQRIVAGVGLLADI